MQEYGAQEMARRLWNENGRVPKPVFSTRMIGVVRRNGTWAGFYIGRDVELVYINANDPQWCGVDGDSTETLPKGWYYWFCVPGCLPDSSPQGPFTTEAEALADAQSESEGQS